MALTDIDAGRLADNVFNVTGANKNLIINGAMQVAQRGSSGVTTSGYGTVDRFSSQWSSGSVTQTQETLSSGDPYDEGFRNFLRQTNTTVVSVTDSSERKIRHYIEAQNVANSGWNYTNSSSYITLSFWIRSSVAQEFYGYLRSLDGTSQGYGFSTGSLTADTWTKVTKTVPGNSNLVFNNDNGAGLEVVVGSFFGTNFTDSGYTLNSWAAYSNSSRSPDYTTTWATTAGATFDLTGVQLEVGSVATPFEHRSYGDELARCQRYYYQAVRGLRNGVSSFDVGNGGYYSNSQISCIVRFPQPMRSMPSLVAVTGTSYYKAFRNNTNEDFSGFLLDSVMGTDDGFVGFSLYQTGFSATAGQSALFRVNNNAARLGFDSEL